MALFLMMSAWFDANGSEVPDAFTVPYALLGASASILHERYLSAAVVLAVIILVLTPKRPKWMMKLNEKLVLRAYHNNEEAIEAEVVSETDKAVEFQKQFGGTADIIANILYVAVPLLILGACRMEGGKGSAGVAAAFAVTSMVAHMIYLMRQPEDDQRDDGEPPALTAFGGADVLVFAGMFGLYGLVSWAFCLCVTLLGYLLWVLAKRIVKKEKVVASALLPAVFLTGPIRLYVALVVCEPIVTRLELMLLL